MDKPDKTDDTKNPSRDKIKEPKPVDFAERLKSLSDSQLKKLGDLIKGEVKDRAGNGSVIGRMSDAEFNKLRDDLTSKSDKAKK